MKLMAHWDEERDKRRVEMMRGCELVGTEELIKLYEERGDDTYWNQFVELPREDVRRRCPQGALAIHHRTRPMIRQSRPAPRVVDSYSRFSGSSTSTPR